MYSSLIIVCVQNLMTRNEHYNWIAALKKLMPFHFKLRQVLAGSEGACVCYALGVENAADVYKIKSARRFSLSLRCDRRNKISLPLRKKESPAKTYYTFCLWAHTILLCVHGAYSQMHVQKRHSLCQNCGQSYKIYGRVFIGGDNHRSALTSGDLISLFALSGVFHAVNCAQPNRVHLYVKIFDDMIQPIAFV